MPDSTIPDIVSDWLDHLERQGKSRRTVAAYRRALEHFIRWNRELFGERFDPTAVIARDVRDWKTYQHKAEKAAPSTINQRLTALSRFFSWALVQDLAQLDPTTNISTIRLLNRQPKALTERDLRCLLRAAHSGGDRRDIAIIEVLAGTGIRVGELLDLRVGDILIRERSGLLTVREGKHDSYREIPLMKEVRNALNAYLDEHPDKDDPDAPLWLSGYGPLSHRSSVLRILNRYAALANIEDNISPHKLRHTFATRYLEANRDDLRGLAALLGHSSLDTVMIYTEPTIDDLARRMELVELNSPARLEE
jgi:integrase/recombinase XerC